MAGLPARLRKIAREFVQRTAQRLFALPGYRFTLVGRIPATLVATPVDLWPGDIERGMTLLSGKFHFAGITRNADGDVWTATGVPQEWLTELHGFAWLRDLRALGGDDARHVARRLVDDWIDRCRVWSLPAWRADILAARLAAWLSHYDTFFASGEDDFRRRLVVSIVRQVRHLDRAASFETQGAARLTALKGRILAGLCLGPGFPLERALLRLDRAMDRQILADGGHVSRSPHQLLTALQDLLEVRAALAGTQQEVPGALQAAIDRMAPMLRYLRHADGRLARFNGAGLEDPALVEAVAEQASPRGKPAVRAPVMGFERLSAGELTVLADSGTPPATPFDDGAHAGTLSIEVSVGRDRLIVNCGAAPADRRRWLNAQRATAAHSTAVINDRNSSELLEDGRLGGRRAATLAERNTDDGTILLSMSHDGYARSDGIVHRRRLFLSSDGGDLRGEDSLTGLAGIPFALRFHLHPSVRASLLQSGRAALLKLPRAGAWRLRADAPMELVDSIYFEIAPEPKRTGQIVIVGSTGSDTGTVRWALCREGRRD